MDEKNSSGWYLRQVEQLSDGRLTPRRVIGSPFPFEVHILVAENDPETIARTERLLSLVVDAETRARLVSQHDYDWWARPIRSAG